MPAEYPIPDEAVKAVLLHPWRTDSPHNEHARHDYDWQCAICVGDVPAMLTRAAPHIAAAALRQAAEEIPRALPGGLSAAHWLRQRADAIDGGSG